MLIDMQISKLNKFLLAFILAGCVSYGENTRSSLVSFNEIQCEQKSSNLYLFVEGENIDFEYEKIGLIEVQSGQFATSEEAFDELKYQVWNNCANGIINIEQSSTLRETGTTFVDNEEMYSSYVVTGVAVRITEDDDFIIVNEKNRVSLDFVEKVEGRKNKEMKKANAEGTMSVIAIIAGAIAILASL